MTCPFCDRGILKERIIAENDLVFAFPTNIPIVPGHVLVCPKRHVKYFEDMTMEEREALEMLRRRLKKALKLTFAAEGFNYAWNEEPVGGQSVPHLHLHMLPRKAGDTGVLTYEPREFLYRPGPRTEATPEEELAEVAKLIRSSLQ